MKTPTRDQALDAAKQIVSECWIMAHKDGEFQWFRDFLNGGFDRPYHDELE